MWQLIFNSFAYVISDGFFWPSMAVTVMIGLFVGSTIYDGCVAEVKKMIISLFIYAGIIITITSERIYPSLIDGIERVHNPFAGITTILTVTIFYLLGMLVGVLVTKHAHPEHN